MEARSARKLHYVNWNDGFAMLGTWLAAIALAAVAGLVLLVFFAIVGRSPLAAIVGTIVGVVLGAVLVPVLYFGADLLLSRLVSLRGDNGTVREAGRTAFTWITAGVFVLPVLITVVVSFALS